MSEKTDHLSCANCSCKDSFEILGYSITNIETNVSSIKNRIFKLEILLQQVLSEMTKKETKGDSCAARLPVDCINSEYESNFTNDNDGSAISNKIDKTDKNTLDAVSILSTDDKVKSGSKNDLFYSPLSWEDELEKKYPTRNKKSNLMSYLPFVKEKPSVESHYTTHYWLERQLMKDRKERQRFKMPGE